MIAGLIRGLARAAHALVIVGDPLPVVRSEVLRAATWRAARYVVGADLLDVLAARAAPAREVVGALLTFVRPALEDTGDWEEISTLVERTLADGNGATRQPAAYARAGELKDVVDLVVADTLA